MNVLKKLFLNFLAIVTFFTSCSPSLTTQGELVRTISADQKQHCQYLGTITESSESGWDAKEDLRNALIYIKNETAMLGGNAMFILNNSSSGIEAIIQTEAYRCIFRKNHMKPI